MDATTPLINLGAQVCAQLKIIFYPDISWEMKVAQNVAIKFTELKKIARKFYIDKTEFEMLIELSRYSVENINEMFECDKEVLRGT